jgi:hypothetical protein
MYCLALPREVARGIRHYDFLLNGRDFDGVHSL